MTGFKAYLQKALFAVQVMTNYKRASKKNPAQYQKMSLFYTNNLIYLQVAALNAQLFQKLVYKNYTCKCCL